MNYLLLIQNKLKHLIADLNEKEITTITEFLGNPKVPKFLLNRRNDFETGEDALYCSYECFYKLPDS